MIGGLSTIEGAGVPPTAEATAVAAGFDAESEQFDVSVLSNLCDGRPGKLRYYIDVMIESLQDSVGKTVEAAHRRDMAALRTLGHKIKSTASCGGAIALAKLGQELETETTEANFERQAAIAASLPICLERLKQATAKAA